MGTFTGTEGDDRLIGGSDSDTFDITWGGNDIVSGKGGDDTVNAGGAYTSADSLDGGAGYDILKLDGSDDAYPNRILLGGHSSGFEEVQISNSSADYHIKLTDSFATPSAASDTLTIRTPMAFSSIDFNGAAERDMKLVVITEDGNDALTGGKMDDTFLLDGGSDTVRGGGGDDVFFYAINPALDASDRMDGGRGFDTIDLPSNLHLIMEADTIQNIEEIRMRGGSLTLDDHNTAAKATLIIDATMGVDNVVDGSAETDGKLQLLGGFGGDTLTGGAGADRIVGGSQSVFGPDVLTGGGGADQFVWLDMGDIHSRDSDPADLITDLANQDTIDLKGVDADTTQDGDQAFVLVKHFTGEAGEMTMTWDVGEQLTRLQFDVNGDKVADGEIDIAGKHTDFTHFVL
jgi:Ca2+-binding RTX toxin-like protein